MSSLLHTVGIVVIGRNEGERLQRCLESLPNEVAAVVYVDSGSTDGSPQFARSRGVEVVELDMSIPFSAARARNEGFVRLRKLRPEVDKVQFVDGDCVIADEWLERSAETLAAYRDIVAVWGYRRERFRERSVYNRLCDLEWRFVPPGETQMFGGDVMLRVEGLVQVEGYDPNVIAGEEGEVSMRLRKMGWHILKIDADMTYHDAAMTRFSQWWKRAMRSGHALAQVSALHGRPPWRYFVPERRRTLIWGFLVPLVILILAWPTRGLSLLLLAIYPLRAIRIAHNCRKQGWSWRDARAWATFCVVTSFPHLVGFTKYYLDQLRGYRATIIEYKGND